MKSTNYGIEPAKFPRYGPWYLKILKTLNLCKSLRGWLKYGNLKHVLAQCFIKYAPFIRFTVFH